MALLTPAQKAAQDIAFQQTRAREQQRTQQQQQYHQEQIEAKQAELPPPKPKPVITWTEGGYGSGTSRSLFVSGQPFGTIQIPESYRGREEAYIMSQYPQYATASQVTPEQQRADIQAAKEREAARKEQVRSWEESQKFLKGSFMGREAQARVSGAPTQKIVVGVEAAKQAEKIAAQEKVEVFTPGELLQAKAMVESPTARFASVGAQQRLYDIVSRQYHGVKPVAQEITPFVSKIPESRVPEQITTKPSIEPLFPQYPIPFISKKEPEKTFFVQTGPIRQEYYYRPSVHDLMKSGQVIKQKAPVVKDIFGLTETELKPGMVYKRDIFGFTSKGVPIEKAQPSRTVSEKELAIKRTLYETGLILNPLVAGAGGSMLRTARLKLPQIKIPESV